MDKLIEQHIPQRPPFLFIEKVIEHTNDFVITSLQLTGKEDFFKGHFPHRPVMPGVLMCEAVFQTGALLMSLRGEHADQKSTAVVTRIQNTKFKNLIEPPAELQIRVDFVEMLANAAFMKGKVTSAGKTVMTIEFAAAIIGDQDA